MVLINTTSFSQEEKESYKNIASKFKLFYNEGSYEDIFNMFDASMKTALPLEKALQFFQQNVNDSSGKIVNMVFYKTKQNAHIYKTTFEKAILDILISLDENNGINRLYIVPHKPEDTLPVLKRNITKMILPFNEEWNVIWGGTNVEDNYHVEYKNQKYAYDLLILKDEKSYIGDATINEDYFVFGKEIIAPCDAKVVRVINGVHDNIPGDKNPLQVTGNTIILKTINNEYILFAHLKEESIRVKKGQIVKQGDVLGQCGNSGNSTEPHLHLSLQNVENMNIATGAQLFFEKIKVNGEIKEDYLPVKGEKIKNID